MKTKCLGCKLDNSFTEYQKRRNKTSILAMRRKVEEFFLIWNPFFAEVESGVNRLDALDKWFKDKLCQECFYHIPELLNLVSETLKDENQKVWVK